MMFEHSIKDRFRIELKLHGKHKYLARKYTKKKLSGFFYYNIFNHMFTRDIFVENCGFQ